MKKITLLIALAITTIAFGQQKQETKAEYKIVGKEIVKIDTTKGKTKAKATKTDLVYKVKGVAYPVYRGTRGGYYIERVSKKTGKTYKQYLKVKQ